MSANVPRLDLAPKLKRPLQPWNPLDYLRLLYWVFFFPQALRWYVETFADPRYRKATGPDLLPALREDPVQKNMALMGLLSILLAVPFLITGLQWVGVPVNWGGVALIVMPSVLASVTLGVELGKEFGLSGVALGVALGVASSVAFSVAYGVANSVRSDKMLFALCVMLGMALGVVANVAFGVVSGVRFGVALVVAAGVAVGVMVGRMFGALLLVIGLVISVWAGVRSGMVSEVITGVVLSVVLGVLSWVIWVVLGIMASVATGVAISRFPDYLAVMLPTAWKWSRGGGNLHHVTLIPLPNVQKQLEAWLEIDWAAGVYNVNQILAYTLQFIPAVHAVNRVLERMPEERILPAVAELARAPYDWNLVRFSSASLQEALFREPKNPEPRLDTPARAACAGFWYLHEKKLEEAVRAFEVVRHLPYGNEMLEIASALKAAMEAESVPGIAAWANRSAIFSSHEKGPSLRPGTTAALRQLAEAAGEIRTAREAVSPALRSAAVGRAIGILTRLIETAGETCEPPEADLIREVAVRWREVLTRWIGEIGEEVLLHPVENPFMEGASGRPVRKTFVGRSGVLERLERWWASPPDTPLPVLILYGHRRMGKSSILLRLQEKRPPNILIASTDMQDLIAADHTGQLLQKFAGAIHAAARTAGLDPGPPPDRAEYASFGQATEALNRLLERLDPQMAGRRLVLTVDEYELIEEKIEVGKFEPDFLRYLRAALGRHLWLNLILAGRQRLEEELRHYHAVFYGSAEPVKVTFLSRDEAVWLIRRPTDDFALDMEEPLAEEIYRLTGGQPYLIQRLCYELVERWNERFRREGRNTPRRVTVEDLRAMLTPEFFREFFLTAEYYFSGVWEEAGPDGQRILQAFAGSEQTVRSRQDLIQAAGLDPEAGEKAFQTLIHHDLVTETEEGIRLSVPLMAQWLRMALYK
ncbi:MAG: ATP-binding protein [Thermoflexus hugenholtzii]|uniref:AAA family ATPase n=1 Tax=Thermoflexus TaxID=1495649 RepID=UPI001C76454F|nr:MULTISPECIES: ATP-binding protein [Thermoflexus]QWK11032.1 MAG: ATP-binding protein [Thermoflexus hugenholtzii]